MKRLSGLLFIVSLAAPLMSQAQPHPRDGEIHDPDTLAWWHTTEALSNDSMEGRDTGSAAYQRAADYVANRFKIAGLKPAGENGGYFQPVPMHEVSVMPEGTSFALISRDGAETALQFLQQITITPADDLPIQLEAPLTFRGYCGKDAMGDIDGKIVVCFGTQREGLPSAAMRAANARDGNALGLINVDDPYFTIEPPRWPYAYARTVTLRPEATVTTRPRPLAAMRLSAEAFATFLGGTGQDAGAILKLGGDKHPLPTFEIPRKLRIQLHVTQRDISSPNILAKLRGADSKRQEEYVVIAAHLDGYGFGTPVNGDNLYNGTLEALSDSTLGETARAVARTLHIEVRPDGEPERNLLRRADQYPFLTIHVPAISFIFGYDPNTDAERRYREWYQIRYHRPQDDITQPMDFAAAAKFNTFFYDLVEAIANAPARPAIYPTSSFAANEH